MEYVELRKKPLWIVEALEDLRMIASHWKLFELSNKISNLVEKAIAKLAPENGIGVLSDMPDEVRETALKYGGGTRILNAINQHHRWRQILDSLQELSKLAGESGEVELGLIIARVAFEEDTAKLCYRANNLNRPIRSKHLDLVK